MRTRRSILALGLGGSLCAADDFARLLERFASVVDGEIGFAMRHLESGETVSLRGSERFPMASVYKLPIAIEVLARVDEGRLTLDRTLRLGVEDLRLGLGNREVEELVSAGRGDFTVEELLRRMLVDSDNASSDALLRLVGSATVTARMRRLGVPGIRVDRFEHELLLDFIGASTEPPDRGWSLGEFERRYRAAGAEQRRAALVRFLADPRDTATPTAIVELLAKVYRRQVLQPTSGDLLVRLLEDCATGRNRLRGDLPQATVFAHRTGTTDTTEGVTGSTNDAGILTLPGDRGHVAMAAFLRTAKGTREERERVLARIGRAVFERYVGA